MSIVTLFFLCMLCPQHTFSQSFNPWYVQALNIDSLLATPNLSAVPPTVIAAVDSGISCRHSAFATGRIDTARSKSFIGGNPCLDAAGNHGTLSANIMDTVASGNAILVSLQVSKEKNGIPVAEAEAIVGAFKEIDSWNDDFLIINANIVSLTPFTQIPGLTPLLGKLEKKALIVVPAGNQGIPATGAPCYQAYDLPNVICEGALTRDGLLATFSNWGPRVDIAAFGVNIPGNGMDGGSGTSFSEPMVSGLAALLYRAMSARGYHPTPALLKKILVEGSYFNPNLSGDRDGIPLLGNPRQLSGENLITLATEVMSPMWVTGLEIGVLFSGQPTVVKIVGAPVGLRQLDLTLVFRGDERNIRISPLFTDNDTITFFAPVSGHYLLSLEIEGTIVTNEHPVTILPLMGKRWR